MADRNKIILLDDRFPTTGEPTIQPVVLWGLRSKPFYESLSKEASSSPALEYIRTVQPVPGRTIVLILGLGSFEFYGLNRNGDGFNERPYKVGIQPTCGCCNDPHRDAWVMEDECVQHHYKSYEQGHVFRHHVNKDPKRAIGKVLKAFWNPYMHRVEVLEDIDNRRAPDLAEQIADGEYPAKSMGCRIKFDVCTKCGHRSPTRKKYCDHLKWEMGKLDPETGIRYGALNPTPRFFDSSWVIRPADRTGYLLKKVAHIYEVQGFNSSEAGELVDALNVKAATAQKVAVIDKVVKGYPAAVVSGGSEAQLVENYRNSALPSVVENTPELSYEDLKPLAAHNLAKVLTALSRSGIILTTPEFVQLFIEKMMPGTRVPTDVLENLTALQGEIFELLAQRPSLLGSLTDTLTCNNEGACPCNSACQKEAAEVVRPLLEKRSTVPEYLHRRFVPYEFRHDEPPKTELMQVVDPDTGRVYQTTRGASEAAEDVIARSKILQMLGSGGLLAGAYKTLMAAPGAAKLLSVPMAGGGVWLGHEALREQPSYVTTSGERIPQLTELQEKRSHVMDLVNALGMDYQLTKTGANRLHSVERRVRPKHGMYLFLQKQAGMGIAYPDLSLDRVIMETEKTASDGITEEVISLEKVAEIIGTLVWETL
jgi:hypothetical protein